LWGVCLILIYPCCSPRLATFVAKKKIQIYDFVFLVLNVSWGGDTLVEGVEHVEGSES